MPKLHRSSKLFFILTLVIIIMGVWGVVITLQTTHNDPSVMPTLAHIAKADALSSVDDEYLAQIADDDVTSIKNSNDDIRDEDSIDNELETVLAQVDVAQAPVTNQFVLEFSDDYSTEDIATYVESLNIELVNTSTELNRVVVIAEPTIIQTLSSDLIVSTEPDYYASALLNLPPTDPLYSYQWNLDMIGAPSAWIDLPTTITPIRIAIIDSGMCFDHSDMQGMYSDFQHDYVEDDNIPQDEFGHGCSVTGVIASQNNNIGGMGIAPFAEIIPLRVLDEKGSGTYSDIAQAIVDATDQGAQIINLSLGGYNASNMLRTAINYALAHDVFVVAATGNTGQSTPLYPAAYDGVIAVGSVNANREISSFSNRGEDTLAPGEAILVPYINNDYVYMSGTSLAAPHVVGIIALDLALGRDVIINDGIIGITHQVDILPTQEPTPNATEPPEFVTKDGRTIPYIAEPEIIKTDRWAVHLQPNADADSVATQLGFKNLGQVGALDDYYVFVQEGTGNSEALALSAGQALSASPLILEFEQEIALNRELRAIPSDPLVNQQWHLINTGQTGGTSGYDINVEGAWNEGYDGSDVTIAIVDDGMEITHPDLASKYLPYASYDFNGDDDNPSHEYVSDRHGTSVAGVAAADNDGAQCGVGVAYNANLSAIKLIGSGYNKTDSQEAGAFNYAMEDNDIYNNSWGPFDTGYILEGPGTLASNALISGVTNGRDGKGVIYIFAAGNGAQNYDHSNADGYANSRYTIAVAATDDTGEKSYYSEAGTNILVNAPAGPSSTNDPDNEPAGIVTTDRTGTNGYNNSMGFSDNCTDGFGGTSSAAPTVAGVVALMLDANPNLTWRDVQHILVETSFKNDPTDDSWDMNNAGYDYSIDYGFGTVDATAAVNLAKTWTTVDTEINYDSGEIDMLNTGIPDGTIDFSPGGQPRWDKGLNSSVFVPNSIQIESVEVEIDAYHNWRGDLLLYLTSPSGTRSYIYPVRPYDNTTGNLQFTVSSMEFWGENSNGVWTLSAYDGYRYITGSMRDWRLKINGTQGSAPDGKYYVGHAHGIYEAVQAINLSNVSSAVIELNPQHEYIADSAHRWWYEELISVNNVDLIINGNSALVKSVSPDVFKFLVVGVNASVTLNDITISGFSGSSSSSNEGGAIHNKGTLIINQSSVRGGANKGGAIYNLGTLEVNDSTLGGSATQGGALYLQSGIVDLQNTTISNSVAGSGAGIYNTMPLTLNNITFSNNKADNKGGAIYNVGTLTIVSGTFIDNIAHPKFNNTDGYGGAIYANGDVDISESTFINNLAFYHGGAISVMGQGSLILTNSIFDGNTVDATSSTDSAGDSTGGGAIHLGGTSGLRLAEIRGVKFTNNTATNTYGGAMLLGDTVILELDDSEFTNNYSGLDGGAIQNSDSYLYANRILLDSNIAHENGGAIAIQDGSGMITELRQVMMSNNQAETGHGGAVYGLFSKTMTISNATITGNSAHKHGGAAYFRNYGSLYIDNSTITNNTADSSNTGNYDVGGLFNYYEPEYTNYVIHLTNTILDNNIDGSPSPNNYPDCVSRIHTHGNNIIGDATSCNLVGDGNNNIGVDPQLEPLLFNGGFSLTYAISTTSPAYDAVPNCLDSNGNPLLTDIRGIARPQGSACDIGAFELTLDFPADPTGLMTTPVAHNAVQLDWTDNASDESQYVIERSLVGQNIWTEIGRVSANITTYTDSTLVCDDSFDYQIFAFRAGDNRLSENSTGAVTGSSWLCPPDQPTNVTVSTVLYQDALDINWQDSNDDESEFRILRSITNTGGFVEIGTAGVDATTYNDTTVPDCYTEYFYQVQVYRALDGQLSPLSDIASATTSCTIVTAPHPLTTDGTEDVMDLTWVDNSPDETSFEIQRSISGANSWSPIDSVLDNVTTYTDLTTACGSAYDYQVRAYRDGDTNYSLFSNTSSATQICAPPPAPSNLILTALPFSNDIQLDWTDNSNSETDFYIERSTDGSNWIEITSVIENVITYTDTDVTLDCYTPYHYQVRAYRDDDGVFSDYSNIINISTWCDPDLLVDVLNPITENQGTSNVSDVIGFPQPSCGSNMNHAYVWEFPAVDGSIFNLNTFGSSFNTVMSIWQYDGTAFSELSCNDDSALDGTSALVTGFPLGSRYLVIVGGKNNTSGNITLHTTPLAPPTATPPPTATLIPTATESPDLTTIGVFKDGIWQFRDSNTSGVADLSFRFGTSLGTGWIPLIGDWDGDGNDGIGLYKDGRWILRDMASGGSSADYNFKYGANEAGWQPVVGDWNGDGTDGIGLYKDGTWMLKNTPSSGTTSDYNFRFNTSGSADAIAIAGDWHDEAIDRVGLYYMGRWYLSYEHRTSNNAKNFQFGPTDGLWQPIVGDWDEDGDDTIGVYKDGGWRLRNTNSRGNPDLGMSFGSNGTLAIAGYRGVGSLALFASIPDFTALPILPTEEPLTTIATIEPTEEVDATVTPAELTEEAIFEATNTPTSTLMPTLTTTPTMIPTLTPSSTWIPTFTATPTARATEALPSVPANVSGS